MRFRIECLYRDIPEMHEMENGGEKIVFSIFCATFLNKYIFWRRQQDYRLLFAAEREIWFQSDWTYTCTLGPGDKSILSINSSV